ncbi:MAG: GerMN domain-containing protein, partial [Bowdeniella nasicola]|nr:GerMN domain-containing protein [Bowdeniella nasicola]
MRIFRSLTLLVVLTLITACATLPTSGPVNTSQPDAPERSAVDVIYSGPSPDASPQAIVEGFLAASSSGYGDDFATARLYLTDDAAEQWDPYARVDILDASKPTHIEVAESSAVTVTTTLAADVDPHGRLATKDTPVETERRYRLVTDNADQWRIAELPDGLMMADVTFENHFDRIPLHFISPDRRVLVPETRWFPRHTAVRSATQALLYGPSSWLAPAVTTAAPTKARLESVSEGPDGVAAVDLTTPATLSETERAEFFAQLQRTLRQIPAVQSLSVRINGTPMNSQSPAVLST